MAGASTSEDAVTRDLPKIIAWMQSLGLAARKSRYSRYEKHIEAFYSKHADQLSEDGEERFDSLSQAYRECIDIFMVYKCFNGVIHPNFVSKLRHVVTGQDVPDLEMAGPSRDYPQRAERLAAGRSKHITVPPPHSASTRALGAIARFRVHDQGNRAAQYAYQVYG